LSFSTSADIVSAIALHKVCRFPQSHSAATVKIEATAPIVLRSDKNTGQYWVLMVLFLISLLISFLGTVHLLNKLRVFSFSLGRMQDEVEVEPFPEEIIAGVKCVHNSINCFTLVASCCNMQVKCRKCHDEAADHKFKSAEFVLCPKCDDLVEIAHLEPYSYFMCHRCSLVLGDYACTTCGITLPKKKHFQIFHCDECKSCLKGMRHNFQHCDNCKCCIGKGARHK
jgi:hypothetical protein